MRSPVGYHTTAQPQQLARRRALPALLYAGRPLWQVHRVARRGSHLRSFSVLESRAATRICGKRKHKNREDVQRWPEREQRGRPSFNYIDEVSIVKGKYGSSIAEPLKNPTRSLHIAIGGLLVHEMANRAVAALLSSPRPVEQPGTLNAAAGQHHRGVSPTFAANGAAPTQRCIMRTRAAVTLHAPLSLKPYPSRCPSRCHPAQPTLVRARCRQRSARPPLMEAMVLAGPRCWPSWRPFCPSRRAALLTALLPRPSKGSLRWV